MNYGKEIDYATMKVAGSPNGIRFSYPADDEDVYKSENEVIERANEVANGRRLSRSDERELESWTINCLSRLEKQGTISEGEMADEL